MKKIIKDAVEKKRDELKGSNPNIDYTYTKDGKTIEIVLKFRKDKKTGEYELRTMYPEGGDGVYKYVENDKFKGWLKCVGKKGDKWIFKKE